MKIFVSSIAADSLASVHNFRDDLASALRHRRPEIDLEIVVGAELRQAAGEPWPPDLARALATCDVFIPLCSPGYFTSEPCLREWGYVAERFSRLPGEKERVRPLLWSPGPVLEHVRNLPSLSLPRVNKPAYYKHGLRALRQHMRDKYAQLVEQLAERFVELVPEVSGGQPEDEPPHWDDARCEYLPVAPAGQLKVVVSHAVSSAGVQSSRLAKFRDDLIAYLGFAGLVDVTVELVGADQLDGDAMRHLADCHIFMPLLTDSYFALAVTAKTWQVFAERESAAKYEEGHLVVPVRWESGDLLNRIPGRVKALLVGQERDDIPKDTEHFVPDDELALRDYSVKGLARLLAMPEERSRYESALWRIAYRVYRSCRNGGDRLQLPSLSPPFESRLADYRTYFEPREAGLIKSTQYQVRLARMVADAAGVSEEGAAVSGNPFGQRRAAFVRSYYGPDADDWRPFADLSGRSVNPVEYARKVVMASTGEESEVIEITKEIKEGGREIKDDDLDRFGRVTVVVIADGYLVGSSEYREALLRLLGKAYAVQLIVPRSALDGQMFARIDASPVFAKVRGCLPGERRSLHKPTNPEELDRALHAALSRVDPTTSSPPPGLL